MGSLTERVWAGWALSGQYRTMPAPADPTPDPTPDRVLLPATRVRRAERDDVPALISLIRALADYEREPDAAEATEADLASALFGAHPLVHAHVGEAAGDGGWEVVGMAIWFVTFSTWKGRHGLWLEDLYVRPEHRRSGLGRALLATLASVCVAEGWPRFEWWVLDWNEPAHRFYETLGARAEDEWTTWRLDGADLAALASVAPPAPS